MKMTVLGCGRWGSFLSWYAYKQGHDVKLWGREASRNYQKLLETRTNDYLLLPQQIQLTNSLEEAVAFAELIFIAISAQELRGFAKQLNSLNLAGKSFVLCMKGLEGNTGERLTRVMKEEIQQPVHVAIWVGPGHVQDFVQDIPNCMVIDSDDSQVTKLIVENLGSETIRFYYGEDVLGNEIGAAAKNVIGIAAGILDGLGYSSLKGALMARGTKEIARLVKAMGGNELTVYGLGHLGDYEATVFSKHSHNRRFGEAFVKQEPFEKLAEGAATVKALLQLSAKHAVELPICQAVNAVLWEEQDAQDQIMKLFMRPVKFETI
ncbi:NAD(P)H-dependent glycerol-3-phosphate dehydrogenase [Paenibacillus chondroitinus]|uniref:Glycerol-3-phosphate dehydrogenase n=1 Tax=Paenibacillus chondroitinus TaxID=59842 RepID=A0ABU6DLL3_9BACL|nr:MULTISPECIES: NAD(P)H-dependent glycerol-3-phosphate dehydrogenase [Paenibacillus]MCY9660633.1 NAD(P)H-dependent glycerol-3-phosphate dehydrogenase [Paenibacillus anseongense]MEB4798187.1 NAD(P)H-dependent glycerol-3-phosphate dehydrogenase [Paenibacillus chondroitinus]